MIKVLLVFGTRPETIKMVPVVREMERYPQKIDVKICVTAQHREMLDPLLDFFAIRPDYDLDIQKKNQTLFDITANILTKIPPVLKAEEPDIVFVQGDTTTSLAAALAAFYQQIPIGHIEAGLRSNDKYNPFPEETNRRLISHLADYHFVPTERVGDNLLRENIAHNKIFVAGNTVIDTLFMVLQQKKSTASFDYGQNRKMILVTGHRRESFGDKFANICHALKQIAQQDVDIVYPVHLNPNVQKPVRDILGDIENVHLLEPQNYVSFVKLMNQSYIILTDSGGVQEEAPSLDKPLLVMRDTTERHEVIDSGAAKLVGTSTDVIVREAEKLLQDQQEYQRMAEAKNPYGDGKAAEKIVDELLKLL